MTRFVRLLRNGVVLGVMALGLVTCTSAPSTQLMEQPLNLGGVMIQTPAQSVTVSGDIKSLLVSSDVIEARAERTTLDMSAKETTRAVEQAQMYHMCNK